MKSNDIYSGNVIATNTSKGGVLKTSLTVNIAGVLSQATHKTETHRKNKVCIIDIDTQGNVILTWGLNPDKYEDTIYDVLLEGVDYKKAIVNLEGDIDCIPANDDMAFFEIDVLTKGREEGEEMIDDFYVLLAPVVEKLRKEYDFILIDTPPHLGLIACNVYLAADDILIPFHPEKYSFRSMIKTINTINSWKKRNSNLKIKAIIPVKMREKTITHSTILESSDTLLSASNNVIEITKTIIPESIKFAEAITKYNLPLTLIDPVTIKTKKERESLIKFQEIYTNLVKELGYI